MTTEIIIGRKGETLESIEVASGRSLKQFWNDLIASNGLGYEYIEYLDSRCGRVKRKSFKIGVVAKKEDTKKTK